MVTGENESPIDVPEFLTGRKPSRSHLHRSHDDLNPLRDTTIPAQERTVPAPEQDPINRLADVLTSMQNRPTAQQLTIRPVTSNTMTFDGKSEKFELFEDLFHTMIKMQAATTEQMKINHFHSLLRKNALQIFKNISTANRQTLENVLIIFRLKYVKPESQATAKHKWHLLVFDPNTTKLPDFLEELNQGAEKAFGDNAQKIIDNLLYAKLPLKLKRSANIARLENGSYDEIVAYLERESELYAFEESINGINDIFNHQSKNCSFKCANEWHYVQLLQRKGPHGQGLWKIEKRKKEKCPTRQIDPEKGLP